jgi:hypothetical protein
MQDNCVHKRIIYGHFPIFGRIYVIRLGVIRREPINQYKRQCDEADRSTENRRAFYGFNAYAEVASPIVRRI